MERMSTWKNRHHDRLGSNPQHFDGPVYPGSKDFSLCFEAFAGRSSRFTGGRKDIRRLVHRYTLCGFLYCHHDYRSLGRIRKKTTGRLHLIWGILRKQNRGLQTNTVRFRQSVQEIGDGWAESRNRRRHKIRVVVLFRP